MDRYIFRPGLQQKYCWFRIWIYVAAGGDNTKGYIQGTDKIKKQNGFY